MGSDRYDRHKELLDELFCSIEQLSDCKNLFYKALESLTKYRGDLHEEQYEERLKTVKDAHQINRLRDNQIILRCSYASSVLALDCAWLQYQHLYKKCFAQVVAKLLVNIPPDDNLNRCAERYPFLGNGSWYIKVQSLEEEAQRINCDYAKCSLKPEPLTTDSWNALDYVYHQLITHNQNMLKITDQKFITCLGKERPHQFGYCGGSKEKPALLLSVISLQNLPDTNTQTSLCALNEDLVQAANAVLSCISSKEYMNAWYEYHSSKSFLNEQQYTERLERLISTGKNEEMQKLIQDQSRRRIDFYHDFEVLDDMHFPLLNRHLVDLRCFTIETMKSAVSIDEYLRSKPMACSQRHNIRVVMNNVIAADAILQFAELLCDKGKQEARAVSDMIDFASKEPDRAVLKMACLDPYADLVKQLQAESVQAETASE